MATKLEKNLIYAQHLGWQPRDFGATINDFTPGLLTAITATQEILGVTADGLAGPKTYEALLGARQRELAKELAPGNFAVAGEIALLECKRDWMRDGGIIDLPSPASGAYARCQKYIDDLIRTAIGIEWSWEEPYQANTRGKGNYEWCGAFAAKGWRKAGLKLSVAKLYLPSNYRLDRYARYRRVNDTTANDRPDHGPYRMILELDEQSTSQDVLGFGVRAGDLLTVGPVDSAYGKHICVIESYDPRTGIFTTIEGNGTGLGPDGMRRHGVVRATRPVGLSPGTPPTVYHARRLIRVAPSDLMRAVLELGQGTV